MMLDQVFGDEFVKEEFVRSFRENGTEEVRDEVTGKVLRSILHPSAKSASPTPCW